MAGKTRRRTGATTGPAVLAAAAPPATKYDCAVCHKTKPILGTNKAETFLMAPNGGRICLSCVRNAELSDMAAGRISMVIDYAKEGKNQGWYAVTPSGNARFPLIALPGWNDAQILANPSFMHEGIVWSGRLYKTGRVAFQKTTVATTAPGLPLATRKARARKSQATAAI